MTDNQVRDPEAQALEQIEIKEWLDSLEYVIRNQGTEVASRLLAQVYARASERGLSLPSGDRPLYINSISKKNQPRYPGNREIERRIKSIIRWNAMSMVVGANRHAKGIGGHISTYASAATLYEVAFHHFFKGPDSPTGADQIYFQGHAAPGIYARAYLEGRISQKELENFRRELPENGARGLSSYPHPRLMPGFWQFPTVSMGIGPISALYQARFNRYLEDRGLKKNTGRVWAFCGDGEMDEPESVGCISLAGREKLDNLTFVINCNLQRLDGPVRGNGKIIEELETLFRGAGWEVIKVVWGSDWDPIFERDRDGVLIERFNQAVDGDFQKYSVESGAYIREHFFGTDPRLAALVEHLTDEDIRRLRKGGHDPEKVYAAYHKAVNHVGAPTVILAHTIKGYGLGEAGEGRNITHQQKSLNEAELKEFRSRFGIPIPDECVGDAPFYRPSEESVEMRYLKERREALGGYLPQRTSTYAPVTLPKKEFYDEFLAGSAGRELSTTMTVGRMLAKLMKDKEIGPRIVPIIPDEARTFGMDALFRQVGIYSHTGQRYEPVDRETLLYYKEAKEGQILEEGINEAGSMASFVAAGTAYATHGTAMIPFFVYYSMFGFQRVGDQIWAAGDMRARGFLIGGTAGRTTLAGEGLQHQDGHSHLTAFANPHVMAYDPAFAYEVAVIVQEGMRRMYLENEDLIYYLTVMNETYPMPPMPEGCEEGILKGMYKYASALHGGEKAVQLLGSGAILGEALRAKQILETQFDVSTEVWSVTSYKNLYRDGVETDRYNRLHLKGARRVPYVTKMLGQKPGVVVAASDYVKAMPSSIAKWVPGKFQILGTDGFGRSEDRKRLRNFFEVSAEHIVAAALAGLAEEGKVDKKIVTEAMAHMGVSSDVIDPYYKNAKEE